MIKVTGRIGRVEIEDYGVVIDALWDLGNGQEQRVSIAVPPEAYEQERLRGKLGVGARIMVAISEDAH